MHVNDSGSPKRHGMWQLQAEGKIKGKAGVSACPRGLFHVAPKSCKAQGQCLILVSCRQEVLILVIALGRDCASLAFEVNMDTA